MGVECAGDIQHFILLRFEKARKEEKSRMKFGKEETTLLSASLWPSNILFQMEAAEMGEMWCLTKRNFIGTLHTSLTNSASSQKK